MGIGLSVNRIHIKGMHTRLLGIFIGCFLAVSAPGEVRVFIQATNGIALLGYECTAGELVRAFALDLSVDRGTFVEVSGFFRGISAAGATGYGIFPASLRAHLSSNSTNMDWSAADYTPIGAFSDAPLDTFPGLNSSGVTLEFGGVWDPTVLAAIPSPAGTLCSLRLSQPANVSLTANKTRGGIVSAFPGVVVQPTFAGAPVGPLITKTTVQNGRVTVLFSGGELQTAPAAIGPWKDSGDYSGVHSEPIGTNHMRFYRVKGS